MVLVLRCVLLTLPGWQFLRMRPLSALSSAAAAFAAAALNRYKSVSVPVVRLHGQSKKNVLEGAGEAEGFNPRRPRRRGENQVRRMQGRLVPMRRLRRTPERHREVREGRCQGTNSCSVQANAASNNTCAQGGSFP